MFSLITAIVKNKASVDNFDPEASKADLSFTGYVSDFEQALASVFSNENKNKLLCLAKKNVIGVQDVIQDNTNQIKSRAGVRSLFSILGIIVVIFAYDVEVLPE